MSADREPQLRLTDMRDAARKILERTPEGRDRFMSDELLQVWVIHHLEIIGEAASSMDPCIRQAHPEIDWVAASYMRNRLIHGYFDVDLDIVWETAERDVPALLSRVTAVLEGLRSDTTGG